MVTLEQIIAFVDAEFPQSRCMAVVVGEVHLYSEGIAEPVAHAVGTYSIPPSRVG